MFDNSTSYGRPIPKQAGIIGIEALAISAIAAIFWNFSNDVEGTIGGLLLCAWALSHVARSGYIPVLMLRLTALALPGASAGLLFLVSPNLVVAGYLVEFQTMHFSKPVVLVTATALSGTLLAWAMMWMRPREVARKHQRKAEPPLAPLYVLLLCSCGLFVLLDLPTRGSFIWDDSYGSNPAGATVLGLQIFGSLALSSLVALTTVAIFHSRSGPALRLCTWCIVLGIVVFVYLLRGERHEPVALAAGILTLFVLKAGRTPRLFTVVGLFVAAVIFSIMWGDYRIQIVTGKTLIETLESSINLLELVGQSGGYLRYKLTSFPPILISYQLFGIIGLVENGMTDLQYGATLVQHLVNTLPASLNPYRTLGLASLFFSDIGYTSGGGFMELAEGYLNFGPFGGFIVSFALSSAYFLMYRRALYGAELYSIIWHGVLATFIIRATFYGINDLYKGALAWFLFLCAIRVVISLGSKGAIVAHPRRRK